MKNRIVLFLAVSAAVALFLAFERSGLEEIKVVGAALAFPFLISVCGWVAVIISNLSMWHGGFKMAYNGVLSVWRSGILSKCFGAVYAHSVTVGDVFSACWR